MTSFTPLPGNAARLQSYGASYGQIAESIADIASRLKSLATDTLSQGESIDALAERGGVVAVDVSKAQKRYNTTALAIVEFSVALAEAQADANEAISANSSGTSTLSTYRYQYDILEQDRLTALSAGASQAEIDDINYDLRQLDTKIDNVEYSISQAATKYNNAEADRQAAVKAAIARINPALDALNDGFGDYVRSAWESVGDFLAAIAQWITDVLLPIIDTIVRVVLAVVLIIVIAVVVIAVLFLLGPLAWLLIPLVVIVAAFLASYIIATVVKSAFQPTPEMTQITLPPKKAGKGDYEGEHQQTQDVMEDAYLDSMGGNDSTVIEVIKVVGEDGVVRWRVILPSTQDWEFLNGALEGKPNPKGDQGGFNDFGSNTMLMLTPAQEAAYQRAVRQAMLDAGVGPHDPVMMVGWSQGGILAGRFAENTSDEFNVTAIFVAGSPIDGMKIPSTVDVISVQHTNDIVHKLDVVGPPPPSDNWYTIQANPQAGQADHSAVSYAKTADYAISNSTSGQLDYIHQKQQVFYTGTETTYVYEGSE